MATDRLRDALAELVSVGDLPAAVRAEIGASWHRSVRSGLRPDQLKSVFDAEIDADALLVRAARPVLDELAEDLSGSRVGVVCRASGGHRSPSARRVDEPPVGDPQPAVHVDELDKRLVDLEEVDGEPPQVGQR